MTSISILSRFDRVRFERLADWLAVGVAVSLPWSTSATGILIALWLVATLPTLDVASVRRELATAAGGLPVLLWVLAAVGMLWADVSWAERIGGLGKFHRLLVIPLLLAQFRRSEHGIWVIYGFFASMLGLLLMSWVAAAFPGLPWPGKEFGVPVKDYILQGETFLICAFALLGYAFDERGERKPIFILGLVGLAALFLINIAFVVTSRAVLACRAGAGAFARLATIPLAGVIRRRAAGRRPRRRARCRVALSARAIGTVRDGIARLSQKRREQPDRSAS